MNYLGHAYLSFGDPEIMTGNLIGDHIKGKLILDTFPPAIRKGIELHRKIDSYCDQHPATARAKVLFRKDYGLYSGAIMDTLTDHFLANDPKIFAGEQALFNFASQVYQTLEDYAAYIPEASRPYFRYMREQNWLYGYRTLKGMERALNGLARRASYMPPPELAYEIFVTNFYSLNQCYYELIDDLTTFVKNEQGR